MYGNMRNNVVVNPKDSSTSSYSSLASQEDNKTRLQAVYDLKKKLDATDLKHSDHETNFKCVNENINNMNAKFDEHLNNLNQQIKELTFSVQSMIDSVKSDIDKLNDEHNEKHEDLNEKINAVQDYLLNVLDAKQGEIYDSIETYIANATPRSSVQIDDVKLKINALDDKLNSIEKSITAENQKTPIATTQVNIEKKRLLRPLAPKS